MIDRLGTDPATGIAVVIATIGIVATLLVLVRIGGQRGLTTMSAADVACVGALGAVVGRTTLLAVPTLATGVIALVVLFGVRHLLSALDQRPRWRRLFARRPVVLVRDGVLYSESLRRARISEDDLRLRLRLAGITDRRQVGLAILERTGQISVLRGEQPEPWLLADLERSSWPQSTGGRAE
ncbi:MAG TPA: YetF domain-containing protein [Actinophytocola sp.]|nr:YetF domain-containing protein [Actinophytocola sp.]